MSSGLYRQPGVHLTSWVEMKTTVAMRYEVDHHNQVATLFFGSSDEYVLNLRQPNLDQVLNLCLAAKHDLTNPPAEEP